MQNKSNCIAVKQSRVTLIMAQQWPLVKTFFLPQRGLCKNVKFLYEPQEQATRNIGAYEF